MLRKEFREAWSRLLECGLIVSVIPVTYLAARFFFDADWAFAPVLKISLITVAVSYSVYSGLTLFMSEKRDRAFEYLFSLPLSRFRILALKALPRLLILAGIVLVMSLASGPDFGAASGFTDLIRTGWGLRVFTTFFMSVSLIFVVESIAAGFFGVMILSFVFSQLMITMVQMTSRLSPPGSPLSKPIVGFATAAILFFLPLGTAFWLVFRRMDVKPMRFQRRPFYIVFFLMLAFYLALFLAHKAPSPSSGSFLPGNQAVDASGAAMSRL